MSGPLLDLGSELINEAKLASQSEQKLYKLEQVKEIIFHREKSLLPLLLPDMFDMMLDRSTAVRKFLVKVAGGALSMSDQDVVPDVISLFSFLMNDGNDKLIETIADILSQKYDKICLSVAQMSSSSTPAQGQRQKPDPKDIWYQFRSVCSTLVEYIGTQRNDNLRSRCIKLCEQMILFSLPHGQTRSSIKDPRLRSVAGTKTVNEISMHHTFINKLELEKEAESLLAKLVLWARRGGSQHSPFSPAVKCQLGQSLALLATERPKSLKTIIPALNYLLQGKKKGENVCDAMSIVGRQQLSVGIMRLIRIAPKYISSNSPENEQLAHLREAVKSLDDASLTNSGEPSDNQSRSSGGRNNVVSLLSGVHSADPRKRKLEQMAAASALKTQQKADALRKDKPQKSNEIEEEVEDEMEIDEESIRLSAVSAVDAHLQHSGITLDDEKGTSKASKRAKLDHMLDDLTGKSSQGDRNVSALESAAAPVSMIRSSLVAQSNSNVSTLASDLGEFPKYSFGNTLRLVSLLPATKSVDRPKSLLQSIAPPTDVYSDLSLCSLAKLFNHVLVVVSQDPKDSKTGLALSSILTSTVRLRLLIMMTLTMSARDVDQHRAYMEQLEDPSAQQFTVTKLTIQHIQLLKTVNRDITLSGNLKVAENIVPRDVIIPRTLWLVISHCLLSQEKFHTSLMEGLSNVSVSNSSVKHQAAELIRKANSTGSGVKSGQYSSGQKVDHIDILLLVLRELYIRQVANSEGAILGVPSKAVPISSEALEDAGDINFKKKSLDIYVCLCLVVLSRTIQRRSLRACAGRLLHHVPLIPVPCIQLLEILLLSGTKPANSPAVTPSQRGPVDRGTKIAALDVLGSLLFSPACMNNLELFFHILCPLLWLSVHDDFSTRSSAVNCLVGACKRIERDYRPGEGLYRVRSAIILFASHSALHTTAHVKGFFEEVSKRDSYRNTNQFRISSNPTNPVESRYQLMSFVNRSTWRNEDNETESNGEFVDVDVLLASHSFDKGAIFGGSFASFPESQVSESGASDDYPARCEAFFKRHFHLHSQLCMSRYNLLNAYFDMYQFTSLIQDKDGEASPLSSYYDHLKKHIEKEVVSILPLLLPPRRGFARQKNAAIAAVSPVEIMNYLNVSCECDISSCLPLLCSALEKMLDPITMPASEDLIQIGREMYLNLAPSPNNICLLIPLLGGMTSQEVEDLLPDILRETSSPDFTAFSKSVSEGPGDDGVDEKTKAKNTYLRKAFHRITLSRPPPLSRAKLLVALHHIDLDQNSLKLKTVLDAISVCISDRDEYSADVLKEAIEHLLDDDIPAVALMRTVLLSAQTFSEMQKFALCEVIPRLVRKKCWIIAPKVWDGVLMCVKTINSQRDFEPTIRAFLGLPVAQLKSVMSVAKDVKGIMARVVKTMDKDDINACTSGKWIGLENLSQSEKEKKEKDKILKSMLDANKEK